MTELWDEDIANMKEKAIEESKQKQEYWKNQPHADEDDDETESNQNAEQTRKTSIKKQSHRNKGNLSHAAPYSVTNGGRSYEEYPNQPSEKATTINKEATPMWCEHDIFQTVLPVTRDILMEIEVLPVTRDILMEIKVIKNINKFLHRRETGGNTTTSNRKMDIIITEPSTRTTNHQRDTTPH